MWQLTIFIIHLVRILSSPVMSNGYILKCSGAYWSNPPLLIFDIWAKKVGLTLVDSLLPQLKKCGTERVKCLMHITMLILGIFILYIYS